MQVMLEKTPIWVWGILFLLIGLGIMQMRDRTLTKSKVIIIPAIMMLLSLSTVLTAFDLILVGCIAWLAGMALAQGFNLIWRQPRGLHLLADEQKLFVPGSVIPLVLMMLIFWVKYFINASLATHFLTADQPWFVGICSLMLGLFSGSFIARAHRMWNAFNPL